MNSDRIDRKLRHSDGAHQMDDTKSHIHQSKSYRFPKIPTDALIIIPVRDLVLFPYMVVPISVGRDSSIGGVKAAVDSDNEVGLLLQRDPDSHSADANDIHHVGTVAKILRYVRMADGSHYIVCHGEHRFRAKKFLPGFPFLVAEAEHLHEDEPLTTEIEARVLQLKKYTLEILELTSQSSSDLADVARNITAAPPLADFVASILDLATHEKQDVLETFDLQQRLDKVLNLLLHRIDVLRISHDIDQKTLDRFRAQQHENLLREQLKTIQNQLGEGDYDTTDIAALSAAVAKAAMPPEAETLAKKELKRLGHMSDTSGEYVMILSYIDWLITLPWSNDGENKIDISAARHVLNEDHFGLEKIKQRILEHLAIRKLNPHGKSPILCLVGPPGVGKTSLGQSIAKAIGRKFVRISLGGMHDEAEIRGHRRTYVGALPGRIIQSMRKAGTNNCVMMLDELDKLDRGTHGSPSAALLEVLDPEQNSAFRDNYLALPFDLSKVMFICTANVLDTVSAPLRDRLEVLDIPGYTQEEKNVIGRRYLVPRQLIAKGLNGEQCSITDGAIETIIEHYTREAGVRNLERNIGNVFSHAAMRIAEETTATVQVDVADLPSILGPEKYVNELAMDIALPGVTTGLAWTSTGGELLFVEASQSPGNGKFLLTGHLGEVMRESAQTALTLLKIHTNTLQLRPHFFKHTDIHVHVPAGAIPKDGPSAGLAIFIALASMACNKVVRNDYAMSGEISLRGLVLPVGGLKEKVLAALRAGITTILLPARNRKDLSDIPDSAQKALEFIWIDTIEEAMNAISLMRSNAT